MEDDRLKVDAVAKDQGSHRDELLQDHDVQGPQGRSDAVRDAKTTAQEPSDDQESESNGHK